MEYVTKAFIKDEDINIEHIRRRLKKISDALKKSNQMNLTDINIICEEIFGEILNQLYSLELISTSAEISGNFIAVDLVDFKRRTAFQVTSRTDKRKIDDTIRKFEKSKLSDQIDSLHFLLLNMKKFPEETFKKYEQKSFWKPENIINLEDLSERIADCSHDLMVDIYDLITMAFDSGRLTYSNIMENTRSLSFDEQLEDDYFSVWKQGYGDIQITAFLPVNYEQEISCLLEIRKYDVAGAFITLGQEKLLRDYFVDEKKFTDTVP